MQFLTHGVTEWERESIVDLPRGHGLLGWLHRVQQAARLADISQQHESSGFPSNHPSMKTFLGAPVRYGDELLWNLYLTSKENDEEFTGDDDGLLVLFDAQAARVCSAIWRAQRLSAPERVQEAGVETEDVRIDLAKRTLVRASEEVPLTRNKYELLRCLTANAGKIMTHRDLLQEVAVGP